MSGSFAVVPLMSTHVVATPAVPLRVLKTWPFPSQVTAELLHVPNPENMAYAVSLLDGSTTISVTALEGRVVVTIPLQVVPPFEVTSTSPWSLPTYTVFESLGATAIVSRMALGCPALVGGGHVAGWLTVVTSGEMATQEFAPSLVCHTRQVPK